MPVSARRGGNEPFEPPLRRPDEGASGEASASALTFAAPESDEDGSNAGAVCAAFSAFPGAASARCSTAPAALRVSDFATYSARSQSLIEASAPAVTRTSSRPAP